MGPQLLPWPNPSVLDEGRLAARRLLTLADQRRQQAQFRNGFIARPSPEAPLPAAVDLLRRSGKDALLLRAFMAIVWIAGSRIEGRDGLAPYEAAIELRDVAALLGLAGASPGDRRRVRNSVVRLADLDFVDLSSNDHRVLRILLRRDLADEAPPSYFRPGTRPSGWDPPRDAYFTLPSSFFTEGWLTCLSGSALTVMMAFRYLHQTRTKSDQGLFIGASLRNERFGFSEQTYYAGAHELETFGLLLSWSQHVRSSPAGAGPPKVRRVYAISPGLFTASAMSEPLGAWPTPRELRHAAARKAEPTVGQ